MTRTAITVGSNLGDRLGHLRFAVERLDELGSIEAVSALYETAPVGGPEQGWFLNAVVLLDSDLAPLDLLAHLQRIEKDADRVRRERWGPRTLDLDIVAWDAPPVSMPTLAVPHPRAAERRFVLAPLVDVWPQAPVGDGLTAEQALITLVGQDVRRWQGDWPTEPPHLGREAQLWVAGQVVLFVVWGILLVGSYVAPVPGWRWAIGGVTTIAALTLGSSAVVVLGRELTPYPQPRSGARLVAHGPYRLVRHPIYGAIVLGFAGAAVLFGSVASLAVALALAGFFRAKSAVEERALAIGVPGYSDYRSRVRRRLLPFVW